MSELTFGCDPELFLRNIKTGEYVSAHGIIPGSKAEPYKVEAGAVQVDGMAVEFNIDPVKSGKEFAASVKTVLAQLSEMIGPDLELVAKPTVHFSEEVFAAQPKEALELGCEPDYDAYTGEQNTPPNGAAKFRTGAGHIHIGWCEDADINDPEHIEVCQVVVKQLDYFLGVTSHFWDNDRERRQLYGKKGSYRVKPYGVEYRPLSNAWLNIPEVYEWIPLLVQKGWNYLMESYPRTYNSKYPPHFFGHSEPMHRYIPRSYGWGLPRVPSELIEGICKKYNWGRDHKRHPSIETLLGLPKACTVPSPKKEEKEKSIDLSKLSGKQAHEMGIYADWAHYHLNAGRGIGRPQWLPVENPMAAMEEAPRVEKKKKRVNPREAKRIANEYRERNMRDLREQREKELRAQRVGKNKVGVR